MEFQKDAENTIDATAIPPQERQQRILGKFDSLRPGEILQVIAGHEPAHLLQQMAQEGLPVDASAYYSRTNPDGTFSGFFTRSGLKEDGNIVTITSSEQERDFSEKQFNLVGFYSGRDYKVVLAFIKSGKFIPVLSPGTDLIFAVFKGTGTGIFGDREESLNPGSVAVIPGGKRREIKALTDMEGMPVVLPIPGESDHVEIIEKMSKGRLQ